MNFLQNFRNHFALTSTENKVILFLVASFVAGMGIRMFRSAWNPMPTFDYAASDSEFAARSALADQPDSLRHDEDSIAASKREDQAAVSSTFSSTVHVNLNTAGTEELVGLPGIGQAMAARIVAYRSQHGKFISLDDLSRVKGIGKKKLERLRPYCTVGK